MHIYRPQSLQSFGCGDCGVIFDSVDRLASILVVDSARTPQQANRNLESDLKLVTAPSRSLPAAAFARPRQCGPCKLRAAQRPAAERRNRDKASSLEFRLHHPWPERAVSARGGAHGIIDHTAFPARRGGGIPHWQISQRPHWHSRRLRLEVPDAPMSRESRSPTICLSASSSAVSHTGAPVAAPTRA